MTSLTASCWHVIRAAQRGLPLIDEGLDAVLDDGDSGLSEGRLREAFAAAAVGETPARVAQLDGLAAWLAPDGEAAFDEQLRLRGGPLREQWDARGPGLMRALGQLTEPATGSTAATVTLVAPAIGGHGEAFPERRVVAFEAVLANPHPALPEVLRLGWLLTQFDSPTAGRAGQLGLVAATLAAGEQVELAELSEAAVADAITAWRVPGAGREVAPAVHEWWRSYRDGMAPWTVALADLAGRLP